VTVPRSSGAGQAPPHAARLPALCGGAGAAGISRHPHDSNYGQEMTLPEHWLFESIKLVAQLVGALVVARLAVEWALRRFKKEKSWEKRLQAYTDVILAIGEMLAVKKALLEEIEQMFVWSASYKDELNRRYQISRIKLEESRAMASLLLPDETAATIRWLFSSLEQIPEDIAPDQRHSEFIASLSTASDKILEQGRKSLGVFY
jgi:hypothetical protein